MMSWFKNKTKQLFQENSGSQLYVWGGIGVIIWDCLCSGPQGKFFIETVSIRLKNVNDSFPCSTTQQFNDFQDDQ